MPLYDFECPHKHRFEYFCPIADRLEPIPCEGIVNQLVMDMDDEDYAIHMADMSLLLPEGMFWQAADDSDNPDYVIVRQVPCMLKAKLIVGPHSNPGGMHDHGLGSNRDAAREGRYDPLNPNRRFMAKGRSWRK